LANFNSHLSQAKRNLKFLGEIDTGKSVDWKVTVAFYTALHLINAHVAISANLHYITHRDLDLFLNPNNKMSLCKVDDDTFVNYKTLLNLSRRSRYLLNDGTPHLDSESEHLTFEKHYKKALKNLNHIMEFMTNKYDNEFNVTEITSINFEELKYFKNISVNV